MDSAEDSAAPSEEEAAADTDLIEGIEVLSDAEAAALDATGGRERRREDVEATEIEVTVSVSKFGEFLGDKDGEPDGRTHGIINRSSVLHDG